MTTTIQALCQTLSVRQQPLVVGKLLTILFWLQLWLGLTLTINTCSISRMGCNLTSGRGGGQSRSFGAKKMARSALAGAQLGEQKQAKFSARMKNFSASRERSASNPPKAPSAEGGELSKLSENVRTRTATCSY